MRRRSVEAASLGKPQHRQRVIPGKDRDDLIPHCRKCGAPINSHDCPCGQDGGWELRPVHQEAVGGEQPGLSDAVVPHSDDAGE